MNVARAVQSGLVLSTLQNGVSDGAGLAADAIVVGQWYLTTISGNGNRFLRRGWHAAEEWGAWGNGGHNELQLPLPSTDNFVLEVEAVAPLVGPRRAQRILVSLWGRSAGFWSFSRERNRAVRAIPLPAEAIRRQGGGKIVSVEFHPQLALAPRELEDGLPDERVLGIGISRFRILHATQQTDSILLERAVGLHDGDEDSSREASALDRITMPTPLSAAPTPRRSLPRRAVGKGLRILRAMQIPYFDRFESQARRAVDKTRAVLRPRPTPSQNSGTEELVRKVHELEKRLAAEDVRRQHAASALDDQLADIATVQLIAQRRFERALTDLLAWTRAPDDRIRSSLEAALDRRLKSVEAQNAAILAKLAYSEGSLENARLTLQDTRKIVDESRAGQDQLRELLIQAGLDSADLVTLVEGTRAGVDRLLSRNVFAVTPTDLVMRNRYGYLCVPAEDQKLVAHLADGVLPEPGTMKVLEAVLKAGSTFLDIGAHIGMLTLVGARLVGDSGKVIAMEPMPRIAALLRSAVVMNAIEPVVEVHELAIADASSTLTLNVGMPYGHSSLFDLPDAQGAVKVRCTTIDEFLDPGRRLDLIKIDVEGAELLVLRGMTRTLASNPDAVLILEFCPPHLKRAGTAAESWIAEIRGLGFNIWEIDDAALGLRPVRKTGLDQDFSINVVIARGLPEQLRPLMQDQGL